MGSQFLLWGIFPTQRLNPSLLHCRQILYHCATREAWETDKLCSPPFHFLVLPLIWHKHPCMRARARAHTHTHARKLIMYVLFCTVTLFVLTSVSDPRRDISRWFSLQASFPGSVVETWMSSKALSLTEETWGFFVSGFDGVRPECPQKHCHSLKRPEFSLSLDLMVWEGLHVCWQFPLTYLKSGSLHLSICPSIPPSIHHMFLWGPTLCDPKDLACQAPLSAGSPGRNTGVSSHFLIQGIFLIQGLNPPTSPALQVDSLPLEPLWKQFP